MLIVECASNGCGDELASRASANPGVQLSDELIIQAYVQTHGHRLAHGGQRDPDSPIEAPCPELQSWSLSAQRIGKLLELGVCQTGRADGMGEIAQPDPPAPPVGRRSSKGT